MKRGAAVEVEEEDGLASALRRDAALPWGGGGGLVVVMIVIVKS